MEPGTLVYINYVSKVKDTGEVLEATKEEDAKSLSVYDPSVKYRPRLVSVGDGWVLKGLDEALLKANVGDKFSIEIPPDKAFGERDPSKVRLMPLRKFGEDVSKLKVGEQVEVDNRIGIVRYIGSGRVQLDFNHRLAGKVISYEVEVVRAVTEADDVVRSLLLRRIPVDQEKVKIAIEDGAAKVELPEESYFMDGLQYAKKTIADEVFKHIKTIKKLVFVESYYSPEAKKEEVEVKKTEEVKAEQKTVTRRRTKQRVALARGSSLLESGE
ncbi:MAG: FKBP-type peptidyl-prolyl cis-trans isomerase [Nitrososphaerota archaeon]